MSASVTRRFFVAGLSSVTDAKGLDCSKSSEGHTLRFNPFIFRVCSLLRSIFCMWTRPSCVPKASRDTFFFFFGCSAQTSTVVYHECERAELTVRAWMNYYTIQNMPIPEPESDILGPNITVSLFSPLLHNFLQSFDTTVHRACKSKWMNLSKSHFRFTTLSEQYDMG